MLPLSGKALDDEIDAFRVAELAQLLVERLDPEHAAGFGELRGRDAGMDEGDAAGIGGLLRTQLMRPRGRRATEQRDEIAALHCLMPPVLSTEKIAHLGTVGDCRAAAFQSSLCRSWVIRVAPTGSKASPNVRYAFNSDRICASQRIDANGMDRPCSRPEPLRG